MINSRSSIAPGCGGGTFAPRFIRRFMPTVALLLALATPAAAQDFDAGWEAYVRGDYDDALRVFLVWADQGDADAQYRLGVMYDLGQGVAQDDAEAAKWYRAAAEQGVADAQGTLAVMYRTGQGVQQDDVAAAKWSRRAAEQGDVGAQYSLGVMYNLGKGVPQDYAEAVLWYGIAAEHGDARAQNDLGVMRFQGKGIPRDEIQAHMWFNLAAATVPPGVVRASWVKNRDIAANRMTARDIAQAQRLAQQWLLAH